MISNQKYSPLIEEALIELADQGIESLCPALEKLFNELMLIEREQVLMKGLKSEGDMLTDLRIKCCKHTPENFNFKYLKPGIFPFIPNALRSEHAQSAPLALPWPRCMSMGSPQGE